MRKQRNQISRRAFRAVAWAALGRGGRAAAQIIFLIFLARYSGPGSFAAVSIALIGFQLSSTLATQSFSMALVRYREVDDGRDSTAFILNIALVSLASAVALVAARPISNWIGIDDLVWLLPLMTGIGLISAPTVLAQAKISRSMRFRKVALVESISSFSATLVGVVLAILGAGIWALVGYALVQRSFEAIGLMIGEGAWPKCRPSKIFVAPLLRFTAPLASMQTLSFANGSLDQFFVGKAGSSASLGYYGLARRFTQQPAQMITFAINRAIYPALVLTIEDAGSQAGLLMKSIRLSVIAASVPMFLLSSVADEFLVLVLGPEWAAAAPFLALFAITSGLLPVGGVFAAALRAEGRTGIQMIFQIVRLVVSIFVLTVMTSLHASVFKISVAVSIISVLSLFLPIWEISRTLNVSAWRFAKEIAIGVTPALTSVLIIFSTIAIFDIDMGIVGLFVYKVSLGLAVSIPLCLLSIKTKPFGIEK